MYIFYCQAFTRKTLKTKSKLIWNVTLFPCFSLSLLCFLYLFFCRYVPIFLCVIWVSLSRVCVLCRCWRIIIGQNYCLWLGLLSANDFTINPGFFIFWLVSLCMYKYLFTYTCVVTQSYCKRFSPTLIPLSPVHSPNLSPPCVAVRNCCSGTKNL